MGGDPDGVIKRLQLTGSANVLAREAFLLAPISTEIEQGLLMSLTLYFYSL